MEKTILEAKELSFCYPGTEKRAVNKQSFKINMGEFVLLCGSSGSGKTTLAKCLNGIIPHLASGDMYGEVDVDGMNTAEVEIHELSGSIGMVFQNPEDQIFSIRVSDEVALGVECQGYSHDEIVKRVDYALDKLRIKDIARRLTFSLSGGQKQKVSIASNLAALPRIIVLDDPTTDLDPYSKQEVVDILRELKSEIELDIEGSDEKGKMTFLIIEHELTDLLEFTDRVMVMHDGEIVLDGAPGPVFYNNYDYLDSIGVRIPDQIRFARYLMDRGFTCEKTEYPIAKDDVLEFARKALSGGTFKVPPIKYRDYTLRNSEKVAEVRNISFRYPTAQQDTLKDISLDIYKGEFLAIVGHNGSGKSTLMKNLLGILHPTQGDVIINGHNTKETEVSRLILDIGYVFQNPDNQLFCNSVKEEIEFGLRNNSFSEEEITKLTERALAIVGLEDRQNEHPFSLSRGQRQRLAVATMLVSNPRIIMLDEPTTGLDERDLTGILTLMQELIDFHDGTPIMVNHDMEVVAKYATRVIVIDGGRMVLNGDPDMIFRDHLDELESLKLKPTIIASLSGKLADCGMPYVPNWTMFEQQVTGPAAAE